MAKRRPAPSAAQRTLERLREAHPDAHCELWHRDAFELLVATVLSAQSTDVAVNAVTPGLFAAYPDAAALARAEPADVEPLVARLGMFRQKSRHLVGLARALVDRHAGAVPADLAALVALPGVGRKTANVVLGVVFGAPEGVVVDTHVQRISQRLGWSAAADAAHIERDLMALFPRELWDTLSHTVIFHGRRICMARRPACAGCPVSDACPSAFDAEGVGRKPPRARRTTAPSPPADARPADAQPPDALPADAQPAPAARRTPRSPRGGEAKRSPDATSGVKRRTRR